MVTMAEAPQTLQAVADALGLEVPASIQSLLVRSRRVTTPLGEQADAGRMVWHGWEPAAGVARHAVPLVLLHGGSGSWTHWLRLIEPLTQAGYSLWLADLPGFGESDGVPGGTDVDTMIAPLAHGLEQLLVQHGSSPVCDLIGFSFGGMAAGLLAAQHPSIFASSCWLVLRPWELPRGGWSGSRAGVICRTSRHRCRHIITIWPS